MRLRNGYKNEFSDMEGTAFSPILTKILLSYAGMGYLLNM